jgi:hypothetical protein
MSMYMKTAHAEPSDRGLLLSRGAAVVVAASLAGVILLGILPSEIVDVALRTAGSIAQTVAPVAGR